MKTLLMIANVDWFFISHRLCIAQEAVKQGWKVFVDAEDTGRGHEINIDRITFINFKFSRSGTNPMDELKALNDFRKLYREIKPDVVHHITLKPVIYGSIIAKVRGIKGVVNAVSGLGYNFTSGRQGIVQKMMLKLMKFGFNRQNLTVIFQNADDQEELTKLGVVKTANKIVRIKGSGVDLDRFKEAVFPDFEMIKILFPVRMLWDKGVKELREASDFLKSNYNCKIEFILAGMADEDNKTGVSASYLNQWQDGNYVKWIGYQKDIVAVYNDCHIVILPSYREGMPRALLGAMSRGCPVLGSNVGGIPDVVNFEWIHNKGDYEKIAKQLEKLYYNREFLKIESLRSLKEVQPYLKVKLDERRRVFLKI